MHRLPGSPALLVAALPWLAGATTPAPACCAGALPAVHAGQHYAEYFFYHALATGKPVPQAAPCRATPVRAAPLASTSKQV